MKTLRNKIVIVVGVSLLASCSSARYSAQRKIRKAIEKDPTVLSAFKTDTLIRGFAVKLDTVTIEGDTKIIVINCDSLNKGLQGPNPWPSINILDNKNNRLDVGKGPSKGNLKLTLTNKPDTIIRTIYVPYEKLVTVPGKGFRIEVRMPIYKYWEFWLLSIVLALCVTTHIYKPKFK